MEYNKELIDKICMQFRQAGYKPEDISIYFDIDNTLGLFSEKGKAEEAMRDMYKKGYYKNIPCFKESKDVINALIAIGFQVYILSACIDTPYCKREKIAWIKKHLPMIDTSRIILVPANSNKAKAIKTPIVSSILVDDYGGNLNDWYESGGVGIKRTYSGKPRVVPQVNNLIELFPILYGLMRA